MAASRVCGGGWGFCGIIRGRKLRRSLTAMTSQSFPLRLARAGFEYLTHRTTLSGGPLRLWVEPTNVCNLKCPMCRTPQLAESVPRGLMPISTFTTVIEKAKPYVREVFLFLGGEPLLNKQLPEMVRIASAAGLRTKLHTNATLLTETWSRNLLDAGLDFISFSFDGCDEETYSELRVGGDFAETCANIRRFAELKRELGRKRPVTVVQLIERPDWTEAERRRQREGLRKLFSGVGIDRFKFIRLHNFAGLLDDPAFVAGESSPCSFLWYALNVGFDGTVVPCCMDYDRRQPLGNLVTDEVMDVWNSPALVSMREKMVSRRLGEIELCRGCDVPYKKKVLGVPLRNLSGARELLESALRRPSR
jgi:MoaA/NifB/PqqE/SkfB family radical SAM enzyme